MNEEEIKALQTEVEKLRQVNRELTDGLASRDSRIAGLEETVASGKTETDTLQQKVAELEIGLGSAREDLLKTVAGYRTLVLNANPEIPAEMVTGDTLEAIELAVAGARTLIGKIKEGLEKTGKQVRVPAGAPPRTAPDLSGLSAREKIIRGVLPPSDY